MAMTDSDRPRRLRFRLRTLLLVVAILAMLLVVVIQQMQIGRLKREIDAHTRERDRLTDHVRALRDFRERGL